jgi:hypothetical protein
MDPSIGSRRDGCHPLGHRDAKFLTTDSEEERRPARAVSLFCFILEKIESI